MYWRDSLRWGFKSQPLINTAYLPEALCHPCPQWQTYICTRENSCYPTPTLHTNLNITSFLFDAISVVVCWWTSVSFMLVITREPWFSSVPRVCHVRWHDQRLSKIPLVRGLLIGQTNCTCNETLTARKKYLSVAQAVFNKGKSIVSEFDPRFSSLK